MKRNNLALFKISNYSVDRRTEFSIEHKAAFYRYGRFNKASIDGSQASYYRF